MKKGQIPLKKTRFEKQFKFNLNLSLIKKCLILVVLHKSNTHTHIQVLTPNVDDNYTDDSLWYTLVIILFLFVF